MKRVEYDINKSEYYFRVNKLTFFFSSKFNKTRFENGFIEYVNEETNKIKAKYKVDINLTNYLLLVYYKKIEKRGFKVLTYDDNDVIIELSKDHTFRVV
ncbi:MAG: early protein GP4 [Candidatus Onthovivens sp.]|nr:early protein GP4 [Candidatus Onthovivens sp.]